jgi:hypothetical protein
MVTGSRVQKSRRACDQLTSRVLVDPSQQRA